MDAEQSTRRNSHRMAQPDGVLEKLDSLIQHAKDSGRHRNSLSKNQNVEVNCANETPQAPSFTEQERQLLYIEVLYTIKHKIGSTSSSYSSAQDELMQYAQRAFKLNDSDHDKLLTLASEEKPPIVLLHVTVVEARNLEAKDANGFSDPYCMLGIVPGSRVKAEVNGPRSEDDDQRGRGAAREGRRQGAFTKFSASVRESFRRKEKKKAIPAKYIQTTSVQQRTLNPVWNETFRFDLESAAFDTLHLDVWDHDDEASVFELAKKLNEVQNFKGLGRMFKDIAQSARPQSSADDFLGCVNIPTKDILSSGVESWYALCRRSSRSSVRGELRLKLKLATREDRGTAEDSDWTEVKQHRGLVETFLAHELSSRAVDDRRSVADQRSAWDGALPVEACTILHQHAIQGDLTECQSMACRWLAYSALFPAFRARCLKDILKGLDDLWSPGALPRVEEELLEDSFVSFLGKLFEFVKVSHQKAAEYDESAAESTRFCLRCVQQLQGMKLYRHCCPFAKDAVCELMLAVKAGSQAWYDELKSHLSADCKDELRLLEKLCVAVCERCHTAREVYASMFKELVDADYFSVLIKLLDSNLAEEVRNCVGSVAKDAQDSGSPPPDSNQAQGSNRRVSDSKLYVPAEQAQRLVAAFGLYFPLQQLAKMAVYCSGVSERLLLSDYQNWFSPVVQEWTTMTRISTAARILDCTADDKLVVTNQSAGCSSSAATVAHYYALVTRFWSSLEWMDTDETFAFVLKLLDTICYMISKYCEALHARLKKEAYCDSEGQFNIHPKLCVALNNLTFVRNLLSTLPSDLKLSAATRSLCSAQRSVYSHDESHLGTIVCSSLVESCDSYIMNTVESIASKVTDRIKPDIRRNLQVLCWSADSVPVQQAVRPLLDYLESNACILRKHLLSPAALKLLTLRVWAEVLREAEACITIEQQQPSSDFYARLHDAVLILLDFFQAGDNQVGLRDLKTDHFQRLQHLLWIERRPTEELIAMFYKGQCDMQRHQETAKSQLGVVGVRALYKANDGVLAVEVVHCKDLAPLDANGFSDPYVIVELCPTHVFPNQPTKETSIKKKTLNPVFEDTFEFRISHGSCRESGAAIRFTIMDYDFLLDNDFGGEAFLSLADVPGVSSYANIRNLQQLKPINLSILKPQSPEGTDVLQVLAKRKTDKSAQEFLRQRKQVAAMAEESLSKVPAPQ